MKSISILKSLSTKIINDDVIKIYIQEDFDKNLKEYKEKSTKNNSPSKSINIPKTKDKKEFMFKANLEINNELLRFHLKEEFMKLIFDGGKNLRENLDNLLELNPDRYYLVYIGFLETHQIKSISSMNYFIMEKI